MEKISEEARMRFLEEAGIRLEGERFQTGPAEEGYMTVSWQGTPLCRVNGVGGVRYREENLRRSGASEALDRAVGIVSTIGEYMRLLEKAPQLNATGLDESYRLLNEFNGAVLAAHHSSYGWEFVTWCRDYSGEGVIQGHYIGGDYEGAKRDFAVRAGAGAAKPAVLSGAADGDPPLCGRCPGYGFSHDRREGKAGGRYP